MYTLQLKDVPRCFPNEMDQIVERGPSILYIHNEVCISSHPEKEQDANLLNLMQVANNNGLVFNSSKCETKHLQITLQCHIHKGRHDVQSRENLSNHRDAPLRCTTTTVISRYAKLHATICATFFTSPLWEQIKETQVFY